MTLKRLQHLRDLARAWDMPLYWALTALISLHLGLPESAEVELHYLESTLKARQLPVEDEEKPQGERMHDYRRKVIGYTD